MKKNETIFVGDGKGFVGKSLIKRLKRCGYTAVANDSLGNTNIRDLGSLDKIFEISQPKYVFLTDGLSGGIQRNKSKPADLILDNLQVACNIIRLSHKYGITKLIYLASSCVYPRDAEQPARPDMLMSGKLEPTNASYAMAKLAGIQLCDAFESQYSDEFVSVIPANIFGPGDDFDEANSHVIAGLMVKLHTAKCLELPEVEIWGSGRPIREFIYVDDVSDACIFLMRNGCGGGPINVGSGFVRAISDLAIEIKDIVGYKGKLLYDNSKDDGMPIKMLDSGPLTELGWLPKVDFHHALVETYNWYKNTLLN